MKYADYLKSDDWKKKRSLKLRKQDRCVICGAREHLDVHHMVYRNLYDVKQSDLRVLCRRCHYLAHDLIRLGSIRYGKSSVNNCFLKTKREVLAVIGHEAKPALNKPEKLNKKQRLQAELERISDACGADVIARSLKQFREKQHKE